MNDHDLTSLLERSTSGLQPDTSRLLAGGVARGRRLGRRRRLAVGGGVVAAAVVVGGVGLGVAQLGGGTTTTVGVGLSFGTGPSAGGSILPPCSTVPADTSCSISSSPAPLGTGRPAHPALAPVADVKAALLAALPADEKVTDVDVTDSTDELGNHGYDFQFRLDGALVGIAVDWPSAKREALLGGADAYLPPDTDCKDSHPMPAGCHALPDGSWIDQESERPEGGSAPADEVYTSVEYSRTDGWHFSADAVNSSFEKDPSPDSGTDTVVSAHPPLTVAQLTALVRADFWFE